MDFHVDNLSFQWGYFSFQFTDFGLQLFAFFLFGTDLDVLIDTLLIQLYHPVLSISGLTQLSSNLLKLHLQGLNLNSLGLELKNFVSEVLLHRSEVFLLWWEFSWDFLLFLFQLKHFAYFKLEFWLDHLHLWQVFSQEAIFFVNLLLFIWYNGFHLG